MVSLLHSLSGLASDAARGLITHTAVPRLAVWFSPRETEPTSALFESKFYLLLQGAKRLTLGSRTFDFTAGHCAVSSVGVPYTGCVTAASADRPYLGVELKLDAGILAELLLDMPGHDALATPGISVSLATEDILEPLHRLVRLQSSPADIPVLAPLAERELYYRLLQGAMGGTLRQAAQTHSRFAQIRKAVEWICDNATRPLSVQQLAARVGMSVTSFHRHFKSVTSLSPLAYQRRVRLIDARRLLNSEATRVTDVAFKVGYASASQFSREYTGLFGTPPGRDTVRARLAQQDA